MDALLLPFAILFVIGLFLLAKHDWKNKFLADKWGVLGNNRLLYYRIHSGASGLGFRFLVPKGRYSSSQLTRGLLTCPGGRCQGRHIPY